MNASTTYAATLDDIRAAADRIAPFAHRTPVMTCATLDGMAGRKLFFKCEQFQKVGAFKFRGACNAVMKLTDAEAARGVVTHSSGNHAQALALAARLRGIAAHIVMPRTAAAVKREAVRGYGATVYECEPNTQAREGTADDVRKRTGATLIHPYDNADIIAGQGTAALELLDVHPELDAIIAPVGGGGLLSGTAIAAHGVKAAIRVYAGEPAGAGDAAESKSQGRIVPMTAPDTIADGLLTSLGERTWPVVRDLVERVFTVTEPQIIAAMRLAWERAKMLIEPSSAVVIAAVLSDQFKMVRGAQRIGLILSGGNVSLDKLPW
jgi:threonine dehydratase/serine racemase